MRRYKSWLAITILMLLLLGAYFTFNPSYQKSFEAQLYYSLGDYDKAYILSKEAYDLEPYNRMANSVMVQSQYALRYVNYNKEAQQYLSTIRSYALQEKITLSQQMRMKMMCDIMIEKHQKMQPTILIDKALVEQSRQYYEQFVKLHEQIIKAI
jgi:tetratricopeptide (TPR) repeat protein